MLQKGTYDIIFLLHLEPFRLKIKKNKIYLHTLDVGSTPENERFWKKFFISYDP
jgi:hypothetical protein